MNPPSFSGHLSLHHSASWTFSGLVELVREKDTISTLQEWDELLWPALLDVKHTISEKVLSRRIHLYVKGLLPVAIALGFVFREGTRITLLLEGQKETWSTERVHRRKNR